MGEVMKSQKHIFLRSVIVLLTIALTAPGLSPQDKHETSTPEPLSQLSKELDAKLSQLAAEDKFSGAVLIGKDGKVFWQKAYGKADREAGIPNTVETRFNLGSMNKMVTSVAIAQLVQQGKLKFTDTIAQDLPDYPNREVANKITVHQLLTHTSGLGDFFGPEFLEKKDSLHELRDYLPLFAGKPLQFEPGTGWSYSNAGFLVLGLIVEKLSGQNYYDYVQEHIFGPTGMKHSGSPLATQKAADLAVGYTNAGGKLNRNTDMLPWRGSSAGGGYSTVGDLLKFDQALRGHSLLNAELTDTILAGKVHPPKFPEGAKYAYGFGDKNINGDRIVGHTGGFPGVNARLAMHLNSGYTVVVLANRDAPVAEEWGNYISNRLPGSR
jgi:CubicO group peptidase (beta-lactamase class C family)